MQQKSAIVIGAGIVGLAMARALAIKKFSVSVFDRHPQASGASIRNFGMVWPIGQPAGKLYNRAICSRNIWKEISTESDIWSEQTGSIHLAYSNEEWNVLEELAQLFKQENRPVILLNANEVIKKFPLVNEQNLLGGLFSEDELLVDPRQAIALLPQYLTTKYNVQFNFNKCVTQINGRNILIGSTEKYEADVVFVCSGADFETLYPEVFAATPVTKCKLQMMRTQPLENNLKLNTAICAGLSLLHYQSFKAAPSLPILAKKMQKEMPTFIEKGIHVMAAQNQLGQVTIGDSHEYGLHLNPFDSVDINKNIIIYLNTFLKIEPNLIAENWNGFYPKLTNGDTEFITSPQKNIFIVNGLGGAGMTLSFGLAEEIIEKYLKYFFYDD